MRQNLLLVLENIEKSLQNCVKNFKITKKMMIKKQKFKIGSDSSIGKHIKTPKTTKEFACYIQYWLVIKKKSFIIVQDLSHFGGKSLENHDFPLWAAWRSGAADCALRVGAMPRIDSEFLIIIY